MPAATTNPWAKFERRIEIAPSLLACDYMRMGEQVASVESAGAEILHVDVMDGHFVPNLALSPGIVRSVRKHSARLLDVHLMVTDPKFFAEPFAQAGADSITFHVEADGDPYETIALLRKLGVGVGVVVKPATSAEAVRPFAKLVDLVLVMTVEPGFGGQKFQAGQLDKVRAVREMAGPDVRVEVDGGVNPVTGAQCVRAGADTLVAGADIFQAGNIAEAFRAMKQAAVAALRQAQDGPNVSKAAE